ncbi:MAG: hypothetical protein LBB56_02545 [Chitinispirillales bacterium]|jgi:hypothetical protein|nr:hypothetical protein [Chitinispirillales bacterium]
MTWTDYMTMAAQHSKGSAQHWFRYICKYINKCGTVFTLADVDTLCANDTLTLFQRISLRAAFSENTPTRKHILSLNRSAATPLLDAVRAKSVDGTK